MNYESKDLLLADLSKCGVIPVFNTVQKDGPLWQTMILWERQSPSGTFLERTCQAFYVLNETSARLGQPIQPVADYLILKQELAGEAYTGLDVDARIAVLKAKQTRIPLGQRMVTWQSIQNTVGLARTVEIQTVLATIKAADDASETPTGLGAVIGAIDEQLSITARIGADAASDAYRVAVDSMASVLAMAGHALTTNEISLIKGLGEQPWTVAHSVTIRRSQVEALTH